MSHNITWFEELYCTQYNVIYKAVKHQLFEGTSDDINDIVQETFLHASRNDLQNHPNAIGWLYKTAEQLCMNYNRSRIRNKKKVLALQQQHLVQQRTAHPFESATSSEESAVDLELTLQAELSPRDYFLFSAYCLYGDSYEELSEKTGLSVNYIRVLIHRIRGQVEKLLLIAIFFSLFYARRI